MCSSDLLLNVGPTAEGEILQPCIERLQAIGRWMAVNGSAIRGTQASPFAEAPKWGRITSRAVTGPDGKPELELNLLVFDWPADGRLNLPQPVGAVRSAHLLGSEDPVTVHHDEQGWFLKLPPSAPNADASVVRVRVAAEH